MGVHKGQCLHITGRKQCRGALTFSEHLAATPVAAMDVLKLGSLGRCVSLDSTCRRADDG